MYRLFIYLSIYTYILKIFVEKVTGGKKVSRSNNNEDPICNSFAPVYYEEAVRSYGVVGNFKKIQDLITVELPLRRVCMSLYSSVCIIVMYVCMYV